MNIINFEFKARVDNLDYYKQKLLTLNPVFRGTDHQIDTYFLVRNGRLKLREGKIENALISYNRKDDSAVKQSDIILFKYEPDSDLKDILLQHFEIKIVVNKERKIYFIYNVKFHFDQVEELGSFVEVEAIDSDGSVGIEKLISQCNVYAHLFDITKDQFISGSYSDLLLAKKSSNL